MRRTLEVQAKLTPEVIAEKVIPRLKDIIARSEGKYSKYVLWPEF
jgi:hypothetical protein